MTNLSRGKKEDMNQRTQIVVMVILLLVSNHQPITLINQRLKEG